jgi:phosphoserine phosphatase
MLGIDFVRANVLEMRDGALTGGLSSSPGRHLRRRRKAPHAAGSRCADGHRPDQCIAVGDGGATTCP